MYFSLYVREPKVVNSYSNQLRTSGPFLQSVVSYRRFLFRGYELAFITMETLLSEDGSELSVFYNQLQLIPRGGILSRQEDY